MRILTLLIILLAFLVPVGAWGAGEDCTLGDNESLDWGTIGTITSNGGNCEEAARVPDSDDHIIIPDDSIVTVIDNITYDTDGSSLELQAGSTMIVDIPTIQQVVTFHFMDGQDGVSVGGTSYDNVALWQEAGAEIEARAAYLTWGLATPLWQTAVDDDNDTLWVVDKHVTCDVAGANKEGIEIGGAGDCTTGTEEHGFTLAYTNARNNPEDGGDGDTYLHESMGALTAKMFACFTSGMERGHCYRIAALDQTGGTYGISLDVLQWVQDYDAAIDYLVFPTADREQKPITINAAAKVGEKCLQTAGGLLAADGEMVGTCMYVYDSSGQNGWEKPIRIVRTEDDEDCAGATGGGEESFYFPQGIPFDVAANSKAVIAPLCVGRGDKYSVSAKVIFEVEDGAATWVIGDGKMLFEGTNLFRGVVFDGSGLVLCEGCDWNSDDIHWWNCGTDGGPAMLWQDAASAIVSCWSMVGGPQTDDADGMGFDGVTGLTKLTDWRIRYSGGRSIYGVGGTQMGRLKMERGVIERVGRDVAGTADYSIELSNAPTPTWSAVVAKDLVAIDATAAAGSRLVDNDGVDFAVNGLALGGQPYGGVTSLTTTAATNPIQVSNFLARGVNTTFSGKTWTGDFILWCDMEDTILNGNLPMMENTAPIVLEGCDIKNLSTNDDRLINQADSTGAARIRNNIFHNTTSTNAACSSGTCYTIELDPDDDTDTVSEVEQNLFSFDDGITTKWTSAFHSGSTTGDKIYFGGNAVDNWVNDVDAVTTKPFDLDSSLAGDSEQRKNMENNCISNASATGAGSSVVYVDNLNQYSVEPIIGIGTEFERDRRVPVVNSRWDQLDCGPMAGMRAPGLRVGHDFLYEIMGMDPPTERLRIIDED